MRDSACRLGCEKAGVIDVCVLLAALLLEFVSGEQTTVTDSPMRICRDASTPSTDEKDQKTVTVH